MYACVGGRTSLTDHSLTLNCTQIISVKPELPPAPPSLVSAWPASIPASPSVSGTHFRIKWVLQVIGEVRKLLVQNQKEQKGLLRRKRTDFNLLWLVSLLHYLQDDRQCLSSFPHDLCCLLSGGVLGGSSPQLAVIYLLQVFSKSSPSQSLPWPSCSKLVQNFSTLSDSNTS